MDAWGFNTIANWSNETLCKSQRKAYVKTYVAGVLRQKPWVCPIPMDSEYVFL